MQFMFISIGFTVAFLMTVVKAGNFDRTSDGGIRVITEDPAPEQEPKVERVGDTYIVHPDTKRSLPDSKRVATATRRRRALSRRDEEQISTETNSAEAKGEAVATTEDGESVDNLEETTEGTEEEKSKEVKSETSTIERRHPIIESVPFVNVLLGDDQLQNQGTYVEYDVGQYDGQGL